MARRSLASLPEFEITKLNSFAETPAARVPLTTRMNPLVLIIDDDASVRSGLKVVLKMKNYQVATAADAEAALVRIARRTPDLVVVDCQLPGLSGAEVVRHIRDQHPDLPILGISGHVERKGEMLLAGATLFLPKPLEMAALVREIGELTETNRAGH